MNILLTLSSHYLSLIKRRPWFFILIVVILTAASMVYTHRNYQVTSNTDHLISSDQPWVGDYKKLKQEFPWQDGGMVLAVEGNNAQQREHAVKALSEWLKEQGAKVLAPSISPWLASRGIELLPVPEQSLVYDKFETLVPILARQMDEPTLNGFFADIARQPKQAIEKNGYFWLKPVNWALNNHANSVDWGRMVASNSTVDLMLVKGDSKKAEQALYKDISAHIQSTHYSGVKVGLTGRVALDQQELDAANASVKLAGMISLIGLLVVLGLGLRSFRAVAIIYSTVLVGLAWTIALGVLTVGSYNPISVVFLVMFIGLGVDFAIHLYLRLVESEEVEHKAISPKDFSHSFLTIALCALTTSVGFLSFSVTDYKGLADLGIISAGGMLMALLATFILIPAFSQIFGVKLPPHHHEFNVACGQFIHRRRAVILTVMAVVLLVAAVALPKVYFDFSTLALKSPSSPAMQVYSDLAKKGVINDESLYFWAPDNRATKASIKKLEALPNIAKVSGVNQLLPHHYGHAEARMDQLFDQFSNLDLPDYSSQQLSDAQSAFIAAINIASKSWTQEQQQYWMAIKQQLLALDKKQRAAFSYRLLSGIEPLADQVSDSGPTSWTVKDIPADIRSLYVAKNGDYLWQVMPAASLSSSSDQTSFIHDVQQLAPQATGRIAAEYGAGQVVLKAFYTAVSLTIVCVILLLALSRLSVWECVLVLLPILATVLFTLAATVWFGRPLNMANIIVVPLIFALGIDSGVHVVTRVKEEGSVMKFMLSSTPKATFLSSLTTVMTFGALATASHVGMSSIGFVLTVALIALIIFTLLGIPALMSLREQDTNR